MVVVSARKLSASALMHACLSAAALRTMTVTGSTVLCNCETQIKRFLLKITLVTVLGHSSRKVTKIVSKLLRGPLRDAAPHGERHPHIPLALTTAVDPAR